MTLKRIALLNSITILLVVVIAGPTLALAEELFVFFTDAVGDSTGRVDIMGMLLWFDNTTGAYTIWLLADSAGPFEGDFRVNVNLYNPDTGTTACNPSFFNDNMNDFTGYPSNTILTLAGINNYLLAWDEGDRVATNTIPFGNPDCTTYFRSGVLSLPDFSPQDYIADGDVFGTIETLPVLFIDGFESGDTSAWSDVVPPRGAPIADFTWSPIGNQTIRFNNSSTGDQPLTFRWDFGDGSTSTEQNPDHTYANPSPPDYNVSLTATNALGTDTIIKAVTVPP